MLVNFRVVHNFGDQILLHFGVAQVHVSIVRVESGAFFLFETRSLLNVL